MRSTALITRYFFLGAIAFWLPDVVLHALRVNSFISLTSFPLVGLLAAYVIRKALWRSTVGPSIAIFMLLGVWLSASTAMMMGASFSGGGFATGIIDTFGVIVLGLIPPYTLMMAAYDGSILGLILAFLLMPAAHFVFEINHWILSPRTVDRLRNWYEHRVS